MIQFINESDLDEVVHLPGDMRVTLRHLTPLAASAVALATTDQEKRESYALIAQAMLDGGHETFEAALKAGAFPLAKYQPPGRVTPLQFSHTNGPSAA